MNMQDFLQVCPSLRCSTTNSKNCISSQIFSLDVFFAEEIHATMYPLKLPYEKSAALAGQFSTARGE